MGAAESVDLHALVIDAHYGRHAGGIAVEIRQRADGLGREADVGDADFVAVAEAAGLLLARQVAFDGLERAHGPVREPAVARRLVLSHLLLEVVPDPRRDQGMSIGGS